MIILNTLINIFFYKTLIKKPIYDKIQKNKVS